MYRIGDVHFVRDGHHRVSVARALGRDRIDAYVVEVVTRVDAERSLRVGDLPLKSHERLFHERVPLPARARERIRLGDPWDYGILAEGVEAWAFRAIQDRAEFIDRRTAARLWFEEEYVPVVDMLRDGDMIGERTETEAYMRGRRPPLPAHAHARVERGHPRAPARGQGSDRAPLSGRGQRSAT